MMKHDESKITHTPIYVGGIPGPLTVEPLTVEPLTVEPLTVESEGS